MLQRPLDSSALCESFVKDSNTAQSPAIYTSSKRRAILAFRNRSLFCWWLTFPQAVNMPFPGYNIHLVNEAYGIPPGWVQSSLYRSVQGAEETKLEEFP